MKLVVGLGNPGRQYERSRHNLGFRVVERLAARTHAGAFKTQCEALVVRAQHGGEPALLAKPQTYMNNSGRSVAALLHYYKVPLEHLLVVVDDMDLALGKLRQRVEGSDGGHKGLRSIIGATGSRAFKRLRVGIGRPGAEGGVIAHVLGASREEEAAFAEAVEVAADRVLDYIATGAFENWSSG